jgi:hypothetical protein
VVETAVGRRRRRLGPLLALLAVGILAAMIVSGHLRESKQFVKFAPAGVMREAPAGIDQVEMRSSTGRWTFARAPGGWRAVPGGRPVPVSLAGHLEDAIKFIHVSAPIRVMEPAEWEPVGLREFGLDPPRYTAILYQRGTAVLGAEFGAPNPQSILQYLKLQGHDQVYLMPRFIGEEWEKALREASGP